MKQLTEIKSIRFTKQQMETLKVLEAYDINVNCFIRLAIKEKIKRDWRGIKEAKNDKKKERLPF
jgi:hypothetical protein